MLFVVCLIIITTFLFLYFSKSSNIEPPQKRAGRYGEKMASDILREYLTDEDVLLTNVSIEFDGRKAEIDNIVVNKYGVFIIEVKNYSGILYGTEDDYEWEKHKTTSAGNTYIKMVKNPIKQVKRQAFLLAKYLYDFGFDVWVDGYAFLLQKNSPIESEYILSDDCNLYDAFHTCKQKQLFDEATVLEICNLLGSVN